MRHLATTKQDGQLHLVAGVEKLGRLPTLRRQVVIVDLGSDANLFEIDDVLVLFRITFAATLLVAILAVIHQAANGRHRVRRDFDQVKPALSRHLERVPRLDHPDLLPFLVNQSHLADANSLIDAGLYWSGYSVSSL